MDYAPD